jgi:hypothetical protein
MKYLAFCTETAGREVFFCGDGYEAGSDSRAV